MIGSHRFGPKRSDWLATCFMRQHGPFYEGWLEEVLITLPNAHPRIFLSVVFFSQSVIPKGTIVTNLTRHAFEISHFLQSCIAQKTLVFKAVVNITLYYEHI